MAHPERTCIGCRTRAPMTELVRVVADTPGITLDYRRRLPGRGAWVHPLPACIEAATRRKAWARALKSPGISVDAAALSSRVGSRAGDD
ncbi:MAG TPA: YlxR family protein [Propionibacteriaceae bacterium]